MLLTTMTVTGCIISRESRLAGQYCTPGEESFLKSCIHLKPNGTGIIEQSGFTGEIQWEIMNNDQLKINGQNTGTGMIFDIDEESKSLSAMMGLAKYEKVQ